MDEMLTVAEDEQIPDDGERRDELGHGQRPPLLYLLTNGLPNLFANLAKYPIEQTLLHHRYSLISQIGEGAFARTFLAEDTFTRERVAIKIVEYAYRRISLAEVQN